MKVNEFADKYNVPYQIVYNSTWLMRPDFHSRVGRSYDEDALKEAVMEFLGQRMKRHQAALEKDQRILDRMNAVTEN